MIRWLLFLAALLIGLLVALSVAAYLASPWLAERWLTTRLVDLGFTEVVIKFEHPGPNQLSIPALALATDTYRVRANGVTLRYDWRGLLAGRLASANIDNLDAVLVLDASASGDPATLPAPIDIWELLPVDHLNVSAWQLSVPTQEVDARGRLTLDETQLTSVLTVSAPVLGEPIAISASQSREGRLHARFSQSDDAVVDASTRLDPSADGLLVEGSLRLEETPFKALVERLGGEASHGRLDATFTGTLPWPITEVPTPGQIHASGRLNADYVASLGDSSIDARSSGDFNFDGQLLVLKTTPDSRVLISSETLNTVVKPVQIDATLTDETLQATFSGSVHLDQADGDWTAVVTTTSPVATRVHLDELDIEAPQIAANIEAHLGELSQRASLTGQATLVGDVVSLTANLDLEQGFSLPIQVSHNLDTAIGQLTIDHGFDVSEPLFAALLPDWDEDVDLDRGKLAVALKASWRDDADPAVTARIDVHDALVNYDDYYLFEGTTASLDVRATGANVALAPSTVAISSVDVGFPVTNLSAGIRLADTTVTATNVKGHLLGGTFNVARIDYDIEKAASEFTAIVEGIDLAQVLALEGDQLEGNGTLDGQLPVTIDNNVVSMTGGAFEARAPGGSVRYTSAASIADAAGQPGVDFALRALDDFRYERLGVGADYSADGTLTLSVRLEGHNPGVESGRSIHYNLTVTENIPALLTSLRLADGVTEGIQKRLMR